MKITTMITPLISTMTKDWAVRSMSGGAHWDRYKSGLRSNFGRWSAAESYSGSHQGSYHISVNETLSDDFVPESVPDSGDDFDYPLTPLDYLL